MNPEWRCSVCDGEVIPMHVGSGPMPDHYAMFAADPKPFPVIEQGALVEVEWHDSERVTLGWSPAEEYLTALAERTVYRTAGYFVGEDADHIMVSHSRSDSGNYGDAKVIPRAVVIGVADLVIAAPQGDKAATA